MISNKHIGKIAISLMAVVTALCIMCIVFSDVVGNIQTTAFAMEYEAKLFNTDSILELDIQMDQSQWDQMLESAISEEYYQCDVTINGETFYSVAIRPKGNTSLSSIASDPDNDRYSFKLEFDRFVDGQSCYGLDKLVLNNNYADTTNMKEAIIYDMFRYLEADAPLYNYAKISVNGQYWGVYLALEAVEDSFMMRNFGAQKGYLYKPDGMNMGGNDKDDRQNFGGEGMERPAPQMPEGEKPDFQMSEGEIPDFQMPEGGRRGFGGGGPGGMGSSGGGNLNYIDDELDSYSTIWNGEINNSDDSDHKRVVTALKNISQKTDVDRYLDIDNIVRYMAVHNFAVNEDSLSGSMAHNYYLYESDGKLNIIPWDYNLAWGGMHGGDASGIINSPIDDSYRSTQFFDAILENEEYRQMYHDCYQRLIDGYFGSGRFEKTYNRIRSQIDTLVATDPNSMYTYDEYLTGAQMLYEALPLRAESVDGQLKGAIPSTEEGQKATSSLLIDASSVDFSNTGSFMGGRRPDMGDNPTERPSPNGEWSGQMPEQRQPGAPMAQQEFPPQQQDGNQPVDEGNTVAPDRQFGRMPGGMGGFPGMNGNVQPQEEMTFASFVKVYSTPLVSLGVLALAFVFVLVYKRKKY